jgi:hypothetical protein
MYRRHLLCGILLACLALTADAQYRNIRVSAPGEQPNEVTIALNPADPMNLVAGANLDRYYYSDDGGLTWFDARLGSSYGVWGDPCLLFDNAGNLYFAHLSNPKSAPGYWIDRIVVQRSTDGKVWDDGAGVGYRPPEKQQDKEWLAFDGSSSQYRNSLYMSWTEFDHYGSTQPEDSTRILFSGSGDFGATWSEPITLSDDAGDCIDSDSSMGGAVPAVGPNGEVYVVWTGKHGITFDRSLDGGRTFGADRYLDPQPGGWDFPVPGLLRCNGLPVIACDTGSSKYRGTIYILWSDQRNGPDDTDIFLAGSTDGGATWGKIVRVNDDETRSHQFLPAMSIDPITGNIYIAFYDRRNSSGSATEVYLAKSGDGGRTFTNVRVSETPFTPNASVFLGDYIGVSAYDGNVYPIWTRMDGSNTSVWSALVRDSSVISSAPAAGHRDYGFGFVEEGRRSAGGGYERIYFSLPQRMPVKVTVHNYLGESVRELAAADYDAGVHGLFWDRLDGAGRPLASGIYIVSMVTPERIFSRKVMVRR